MSWWVKLILMVWLTLNVVYNVLNAIYRICTEKDREISWKNDAVGSIIVVWLYLFMLLALWLNW